MPDNNNKKNNNSAKDTVRKPLPQLDIVGTRKEIFDLSIKKEKGRET